MKLGRIIIGLTLAAGVFVAGFLLGVRYSILRASQAEMLAEFKVHYANLEHADVAPQLREYLKSRLYFLACGLEPRHLDGVRFDFGPVDKSVLSNASGIKGPDSESDIYSLALSKHGRKTGRQ